MRLCYSKLCVNETLTALCLVIFIYHHAIYLIVNSLVPVYFILEYIIWIGISTTILLRGKEINKSLLGLVCVLLVVLLINSLLVSYPYYVFVDGCPFIIMFTTASICICDKYFKLTRFIEIWYKVAVVNCFTEIIIIYMFVSGMIDYSIFTYFSLPCVVIFALKIALGADNCRLNMVLGLLNSFIILILGGRMSAMVAFIVLFLGVMLSPSVSKKIKIATALFSVLSSIVIIYNLESLIESLIGLLINFDIKSRSLYLLQNYIVTENIYDTGREIVYTVCAKHIIENYGLGSGFGVVLYLTSGKFYLAHNLFLEMLLVFGIYGSIVIGVWVVLKGYWMYRNATREAKVFFIIMLVAYLLISMSGSSVFKHYIPIILLSLLIFRKDLLSKV